jgi:tetratricopeptide (TPR) repeat protein
MNKHIENIELIFKTLKDQVTSILSGEPTRLTLKIKLLVLVSLILFSISIIVIAFKNISNPMESRDASSAEQKNQSNIVTVPIPADEENGNDPLDKTGPIVHAKENLEETKNPNVRGKTENIYFGVAKQFADKQLWSLALEYYQKVFEIKPDFPELSGEMEKMKFEIENQSTYEKGIAYISNGQYKAGIESLQKVAENSVYFENIAKLIADAEEKNKLNKKRKVTPNNKKKKAFEKETPETIFNHALALYRQGKIESAVEEMERIPTSFTEASFEIKIKSRNYKKRILLCKILFDKGTAEYSKGQFNNAVTTWTKLIDLDRTLVDGKKSFFVDQVDRKKAEIYSQKASEAYSEGEYQTAYMYNKLALKAKTDHPDALAMQKMIVEKTKQLFEEGSVIEEQDRKKAYIKWNQVIKMSSPSSDYYKKALEKISNYKN